MYPESDLLPLSALQHLVFCERQCSLIHVEQVWEENRLTAEGRILHERADRPEVENRRDLRIVRALRLRSLALGLAGQADVVEFLRVPVDSPATAGTELKGADGRWVPHPVEYKRGKAKRDDCDEVQLCAQAMCLEEMMGVPVPRGALFYGTTRRRVDVIFDEDRRERVTSLSKRLHELIGGGVTPPAVYEKKCDSCSLVELCKPRALGKRSARAFVNAVLLDLEKGASTL